VSRSGATTPELARSRHCLVEAAAHTSKFSRRVRDRSNYCWLTIQPGQRVAGCRHAGDDELDITKVMGSFLCPSHEILNPNLSDLNLLSPTFAMVAPGKSTTTMDVFVRFALHLDLSVSPPAHLLNHHGLIYYQRLSIPQRPSGVSEICINALHIEHIATRKHTWPNVSTTIMFRHLTTLVPGWSSAKISGILTPSGNEVFESLTILRWAQEGYSCACISPGCAPDHITSIRMRY
jgi:hypothetical protein